LRAAADGCRQQVQVIDGNYRVMAGAAPSH
jgi:hypothetical protein